MQPAAHSYLQQLANDLDSLAEHDDHAWIKEVPIMNLFKPGPCNEDFLMIDPVFWRSAKLGARVAPSSTAQGLAHEPPPTHDPGLQDRPFVCGLQWAAGKYASKLFEP